MKMTATLRRGLAVLLTMGMVAGAAEAATITIDSTSAAWNVTGNVVRLQGQGTNRISWGRTMPAGLNQQSSYVFRGAAAGGSAGTGELLTLGTFVHRNFTIRRGRNLTAANLAFGADLTFDLSSAPGGGLHTESLSFDWLFHHNETFNNQRPRCTNGNGRLNFIGVNRNGCADHVTFLGNATNTYTFNYAEGTVTLSLLGFFPNPNFFTVENRRNRTSLVASFDFTPTPIPLPAAGWLLLGSLAGLAVLRRRRAAA